MPHALYIPVNIFVSVESGRIFIYPKLGTLEISRVNAGDLGSYWCEVSNMGKSRRSAVGTLTVAKANDAADESPPLFILAPQNQALMEGDSAVLQCVAGGFPLAKVDWLRNDSLIVYDDRVSTIGQGTLVINRLVAADAAKYTCRAQNSVDSIHSSAIVTISSAFVIFHFKNSLPNFRAHHCAYNYNQCGFFLLLFRCSLCECRCGEQAE